MSKLPGTIWITWEDHRRTRGLCDYFQVDLRVLSTRRSGIGRYLELVPRTFQTVRAVRPDIVIVQSPSIILALVTVLWRRILGYRVVVDAHNEAVEPFINPSAPFRWLTNFLLRHTDLTIVTNRALADIVISHGGRAAVLPDRIPEAPQSARRSGARNADFTVAVIATFASDEPIHNVLDAAARLRASVRFTITGDSNKLPAKVRESVPDNVTFCGFVSEQAYWALLANVNLVVDLSCIDNCLVCGGYEALSVGTPLLLSNSRASREHFRTAARYTDNSTDSIVAEIEEARGEIDDLRENVVAVRDQLRHEWNDVAERIRCAIISLSQDARRKGGRPVDDKV
jgi:glycosyltransferase involved in cell wall biosynthesis